MTGTRLRDFHLSDCDFLRKVLQFIEYLLPADNLSVVRWDSVAPTNHSRLEAKEDSSELVPQNMLLFSIEL